jgi:hypothetical protein
MPDKVRFVWSKLHLMPLQEASILYEQDSRRLRHGQLNGQTALEIGHLV